MKKVCKNCNIEKEIDEFGKRNDIKDGYSNICKKCYNKKQREYRQTEAGKNVLKKYEQSEKGKLKREKYDQSEKGKIKYKKYRQTEKRKNVLKKYDQSKKGKITKKRTYQKNKISHCISTRIRQSLNGFKNEKHWENLVGYTLQELKDHLEKSFKPGMTWNNYGYKGWHIDHIKPISSFNITDYECDDFKKCWSLNNLQSLWAKENIRKGDKLDEYYRKIGKI
jgi:hypothetical protein